MRRNHTSAGPVEIEDGPQVWRDPRCARSMRRRRAGERAEKSGEGGIRTRGTGNNPYDGLANRCLQPLGHLSGNSNSSRIIRDLRARGNERAAGRSCFRATGREGRLLANPGRRAGEDDSAAARPGWHSSAVPRVCISACVPVGASYGLCWRVRNPPHGDRSGADSHGIIRVSRSGASMGLATAGGAI